MLTSQPGVDRARHWHYMSCDFTAWAVNITHMLGCPLHPQRIRNALARCPRLLSTSASHAASWPSVGLGLHLDPNELQIAVKWWLDTSMERLFMCSVPWCGTGPSGPSCSYLPAWW